MGPPESGVHLRHYSPGVHTQQASHSISLKVRPNVAPVFSPLLTPLTKRICTCSHLPTHRDAPRPCSDPPLTRICLLSFPRPLWISGSHFMMNGVRLILADTAADLLLSSPSPKKQGRHRRTGITLLGTNRLTSTNTVIGK